MSAPLEDQAALASGRGPLSRLADRMSGLSADLERLAHPPVDRWPAPGVAVVTWSAIHLTAITIFTAALIPVAGTLGAWRTAAPGVWALLSSGLIIRVTIWVLRVRGSMEPLKPFHPLPLDWSTRGGAYLATTAAAWSSLQPAGQPLTGLFLAVVVLTIGVRIAGLDAWDATIRYPLFYLRHLFSLRAVADGVLILSIAAVPFVGFAVFADPLLGNEILTNPFTGEPVSRLRQFSELAVAVVTMATPVAIVCEAIAAVRRYEDVATDAIKRSEADAQIDRIGRHLHNQGLSRAKDLHARLSIPPPQDVAPDHEAMVAVAAELVDQLEAIHDHWRAEGPRPVASCLITAARFCNNHPMHFDPSYPPDLPDLQLEAGTADLLDEVLLNHLGNSQRAGAGTARVKLDQIDEHLHVSCSDDGPGFDPLAALRCGRGLYRLQQRLEAAGGRLAFDPPAGPSPTSLAWIPYAHESKESTHDRHPKRRPRRR